MRVETEDARGRVEVGSKIQTIALRRPTVDEVWFVIAIAVPALIVLASSLGTIDLAYHLRVGDEIAETGAIPSVDTMTATAEGSAWFDQQWLAQVILASAYRAASFPGLVVLRAALVSMIMALVFISCQRRGASARTSALLTMASFVLALPYLALRPQLIGAACFAWLAFLVLERHRLPRAIWIVPLIVVVWSNVHGSFVLAPVVVAIALAVEVTIGSRHRWKWATMSLLVLLATFLNPWGWGVWDYAAQISTNETIRTSVNEWTPPSLATTFGGMFLFALLGVTVWFGARRDPIPLGTLALSVAASVIALSASRNILWWALIMPAILAGVSPSATASSSSSGESVAINRLVIVVLAVAMVVTMPWWRPASQLVSGIPSRELLLSVDRSVPVGSRLFVYQPWASWLELTRPDLAPFVDSRIELFDTSVWAAYEAVTSGTDGWREVLARHDMDAVLVSPAQDVLISRLERDPKWRRVASDSTATLFVRS